MRIHSKLNKIVEIFVKQKRKVYIKNNSFSKIKTNQLFIIQIFVHLKKIPERVINIKSCGIMILQVVNVRISIMVHVVVMQIVLELNKNVNYVVY